jgi:hypothetical protein
MRPGLRQPMLERWEPPSALRRRGARSFVLIVGDVGLAMAQHVDLSDTGRRVLLT